MLLMNEMAIRETEEGIPELGKNKKWNVQLEGPVMTSLSE